MISQRCRHQGRGSVFNRVFTSSIERCAAARVTLAISSFFCFETTPLLFYHGMRIGIKQLSVFRAERVALFALLAVGERRIGLQIGLNITTPPLHKMCG